MTKRLHIIIGLVVGILATAAIFFGVIFFKGYENALRLQGAQIAIQSIFATAEKEGNVVLQNTDQKTGEKKSVKLILEKPAAENPPAKK